MNRENRSDLYTYTDGAVITSPGDGDEYELEIRVVRIAIRKGLFSNMLFRLLLENLVGHAKAWVFF